MVATIKPATAEDLAAMPDSGDKFYLLKGEIRRIAPARINHGIFAATMAYPLQILAEENGSGVVAIADSGFLLRRNPDTVLAPDAAFILNQQLPPTDERDFRTHVCIPTAVIEVASPTNTKREISEKVRAYREAGVPLIWVAYPETKTVVVDGAGRDPVTLTEQDTLDGGEILPGFRQLRVGDIFR
jgi:Uma2 family endonuclease